MNLLRRVVDVKPGEVRAMLLSCAYFFFILSAYYIIRPIRDEMGNAGGVRNLAWLFTGTLIATILAQPLGAALVQRFKARVFIAVTYNFFVLNLFVFYLLLEMMPAEQRVWIGRVFYIWVSVFNMFVVSIFWAFMVDLFRTEQSKRLFGFIGVGGTIGGITGGVITAALVKTVGQSNLLLVSAALLEVAVFCVWKLSRGAEDITLQVGDSGAAAGDKQERAVGGALLAGITHVARSPYLLAVCMYMIFFTVTTTILYFQQQIVAEKFFSDTASRTAFFASVDIAVNVLTLVTQAFLTARLIKWLGVGITLSLLPALSIIGFAGLGLVPTMMAVVVLTVVRRGTNFAIARPTREVLFTVVAREDKYKAKTFIDTAVYRTGDQIGAWSQRLLVGLGMGISGLAWVAVGLSAIWAVLSLWLGRKEQEMDAAGLTTADTLRVRRPAPV
jgi:ATP:ADP antiporter, AAA family